MNKMDLMDDAGRQQLRAILKRLNPMAELINATWGRVDLKRILGTGLFSPQKAEEHPNWLKEARIGEHNPESVEYGISSITFRSHRPFNAVRFGELTKVMRTRVDLARREKEAERVGRGGRGGASSASPAKKHNGSVTKAGRMAALRVVRSKGLVWIATQQGHWMEGKASLAGPHFNLGFTAPWSAATSASAPLGSASGKPLPPLPPWGDRRTELVVIGQDMDHAAMTAALERCVMTEEEMVVYGDIFRGATPPWPPSRGADGADGDGDGERERLIEAEAKLRAALRAEEEQKGAEHPTTVATTYRLAIVLQDLGKLDEAEGLFRRVLPIMVKLGGGGAPSPSRKKGAGVAMDGVGVLLASHGLLEGLASVANLVSLTPPWDQVQPPVAAKFIWGGVFAGAVLAAWTLVGPRPVPQAAIGTLMTMHGASAMCCMPGVLPGGYPKEGLTPEWDDGVSNAGIVLHGCFALAFAFFLFTSKRTSPWD
jgi:G3E family GTPase